MMAAKKKTTTQKRESKYGIIDFEKKGNVVRFYLGDSTKDYYGDDWNDRPYEHNAGTVYDEFIKGHIDIAFPYDYTVLEPSDDWRYEGNSPFCKDDMKDGHIPCIIAVPNAVNRWDENCYSIYYGSAESIKFFFGDSLEILETNASMSMKLLRHIKIEFDLEDATE